MTPSIKAVQTISVRAWFRLKQHFEWCMALVAKTQLMNLGKPNRLVSIMLQNLPIMLFGISLIFAYYACFYAFWICIMLIIYSCLYIINCIFLQIIFS